MGEQLSLIELKRENLEEYLKKNNVKEENINFTLRGFKSDKYDFEGVNNTKSMILIRLRFGKMNGIDTWKVRDNEHLNQILEVLYFDEALTEWIKVI